MHRSNSALVILLFFVAPAWAQDKPPAPMLNAPPAAVAQPAAPQSAPAQPGAGSTTAKLDAAELEQLLGPIALYPDELLANVLAASVYPDEVAEAAKLVSMGADKSVVDSRTWEPPVKAIAKIPDVISMLGEFPEWTTALGQAYLTQAQDVMAAVQSLRKKAQGTGALQTTEQQKVVVEKETVYIESSDPEVVYVPSYQPSVVYVDDDDDDVVAAGLIGFGTGIVVGAVWADLACDWNNGCVGWGNDVNVDIDRGDINIDRETNIGSGNVGSGNRVSHRNRAGREGGAWSPNRSKQLATAKPGQTQNFARGAASASTRPAAPRASTGGAGSRASAAARPTASAGSRPSAATRTQAPAAARSNSAASNRPSAAARTQAPASARQPAAGARPSMPTAERANRASTASGYQGSGSRSAYSSSNRSNSAFQGGASSRADSSRGAMSRQSSSRSYQASRPSPSRSSGARSGGGGRGGGGRGGRR